MGQYRKAYEEHLYNLGYQKNVMYGNRMEGERIGEERGFEKATCEIAKRMRAMGMDEETIQKLTKL